jgi:hypothetical protein
MAIRFREWKFVLRRSSAMRQLWLMNVSMLGDVGPAVPLDPKTRDELRGLMAKAIEAVHFRQSSGETGDERRTISHEDYRATPQPQGDCLSEITPTLHKSGRISSRRQA